MNVNEVSGHNYGYVWVLCSFLCFCCSNFVLGLFVPIKAQKTPHHIWKWRNIANSLVHSLISGCWAICCFWEIPEMRTDLINKYSVSAHGVISLSVGYFLYDFLDMAVNDYKRSAELLVHHTLVIVCLGLSVTTCYYQGFSLVALLVEVNSVFLHLRQLLLFKGTPKSSIIYQINGVFNLASFFLFRVVTMGGMMQWLLTNQAILTNFAFGLGVFSMAVILFMNFHLLMRVLKSDYSQESSLKSASHPRQSEDSPVSIDDEKKIVAGKQRSTEANLVNRGLVNGATAPSFDGDSVFALMGGSDLKID